MFIELPNTVLYAIQRLNDAGFEAYAVGGCVRDSLMGKTPQDWDITTSATPDEMKSIFTDFPTIETGLQHGTLTIVVQGVPLEITTYRVDGVYTDGRHPDAVIFTRTLPEDLRRRDFTVNAMAYHPLHGLIDLFNGCRDIESGIIRCVGNPTTRFSEDALRILRALRFASTLGFDIEADTALALQALSPTLDRVSVERITVEFKRLLCGKDAVDILRTYRHTIAVFLPEIAGCDDFAPLSQTKALPYARLAALFYSAGLVPKAAETALRRLRFDNQTVRDVTLLLSETERTIGDTEADLLYLLNRLGPERIYDYLAIRRVDNRIISRVDELLKNGACYRVSMLAVDGKDLMAVGIQPGPDVGRCLERLLGAVIEGKCLNRKEDLLNYISKK